jgi:hypothetical protein
LTSFSNIESKINISDIEGGISQESKNFMRPVNKDSTSLNWAERIQDGKVNLYERVDIVGYGATRSSTTSLYLESGSKFTKVYSSEIFSNNKKRIDALKSFFSDSPALLEIMSSPDFKNKYDNVVEIVSKYNLEKFDPTDNPYSAIPVTGTQTVTLAFYSNRKIEKGSYITVNGEGHYNFMDYGPASIPLTILKPSKVCLISPSGQYCKIMTSGLDAFTYYELSLTDQLLNSEIRKPFFAQRQIASNFDRSKKD